MTDITRISKIRFLIDGRSIVFSNAKIISENDDFLTFIDSYDGRTKTYSKKLLISEEVYKCINNIP